MTTEVRFTQTSSPFLSPTQNEKEGVVEVEGFAVHVGTFNGVTIEKEELDKSVASLIGSPILKNHENNIGEVIGKVTHAECKLDPDAGEYAIMYKADIDECEEDLIRKMKLDFVTSVSVGFMCEHICSICGENVWLCPHWYWDEGFQVLAKDISFHELSIVAVPADSDATVKINFANNSDQLQFDKLEEFKKERRTYMSDNFENKYNEMVEKYNEFKMEKVDEINAMNEEFKATKEKLEADKADKVEEILGLKADIESLKQEKEALQKKVSEYEESFKAIENERLSALREKVTELNAKVNGGYTEEEIAGLEESTLNRIAQSFENISEHMVKLHKPVETEQHKDQYQDNGNENVSFAQKLVNNLDNIRGF